MKKVKTNVQNQHAANQGDPPSASELLRYEWLTDNQYSAGIAYVKQQQMGYEQGNHPLYGNYIVLFPEQRTTARVTAFEAAIA